MRITVAIVRSLRGNARMRKGGRWEALEKVRSVTNKDGRCYLETVHRTSKPDYSNSLNLVGGTGPEKDLLYSLHWLRSPLYARQWYIVQGFASNLDDINNGLDPRGRYANKRITGYSRPTLESLTKGGWKFFSKEISMIHTYTHAHTSGYIYRLDVLEPKLSDSKKEKRNSS